MICWSNVRVLLFFAISLPTSSAQPIGAVRLVSGPLSNCGRVEVFYNGEWGTVCGNNFEERSADIVCTQLGYRGALQFSDEAASGSGDSPIWIDELMCSEADSSLIECSHNGWGVHNCTHSDDVEVCCDPRPQSLPVRLTCPKCTESSLCKTCPDKLHPRWSDCREKPTVSGIVEVQVNGEWGPVSADGWDVNEATVVCGQLGYPISYPSGSAPPTIEDVWPEYNETLTDILGSGVDECHQNHSEPLIQSFNYSPLQGLECSGRESKLLDCSMDSVGYQPNPTRRVAAVRCGFRPNFKCLPQHKKIIRLRAGAVWWMGRAEVKRNSEWGTICDKGFDDLEGNVICRRLGYGTVKTISDQAGYGRGTGTIHYTRIRCTGAEEGIEDCASTTGSQAQSCGHGRDVGLECHAPDTSQCSQEVPHNVVLKEDGDLMYPHVRGSAGWGIFCHSDTPVLTKTVGEVICRQTRRQFFSSVSSTNSRPTDFDCVYYDGRIRCSGTKYFLSECDVNITPQESCPGGYSTLKCTSAMPDLVPDVAKLKSSLEREFPIQVQYMMNLQCAYQEGCLASSARPNGNARKLLRFDSMTWNWGLATLKPPASRSDWEWHTCHGHYHSMEEFVHYDLLYAISRRRVTEGHKASFCLEDSKCVDNYPRRLRCYTGNQGISPNCGDLYAHYLDCQWIDITSVRHGLYILQLSVNPQRIVPESDHRNNQASCRIEITDRYDEYYRRWFDYVIVEDCWLSDH